MILQQTSTITPEDFGAKGDGVTDNYAAFKALAKAVSNTTGATVRFSKGKKYFINQMRIEGPKSNGITNIYWDKAEQLTVDLNGSIIAVKGDFVRASDDGVRSYNSAVSPFMFRGCNNLVVQNGEIDGRVHQSGRSANVGETDSHGVALYHCKNVILRSLNVHHWQCDGIYIAADQFETDSLVSENITIVECVSWSNARQGLSNAGGANIRSIGSRYDRTGLTNLRGTAVGKYTPHSPGAGIDIEPSVGNRGHNRKSDWTSEGDTFYRNLGSLFAATYPEHISHAVLTNCSGESFDSGNGRIELNVPMGVVSGGRWKNVTIAPALSKGPIKEQVVTIISNAQFDYDDPDRYVIFDNNTMVNPHTRYRNNIFNLAPNRPYKIIPMLCDQKNLSFIGNRIFVSSTAFNGSAWQKIASFIGAGIVSGNNWQTDRIVSNDKSFYIDYEKALNVSNESYAGTMGDGGSNSFRKR